MKSFGHISECTNPDLLVFDATRYPLLDTVWKELEKFYNGMNREQIFSICKGKLVYIPYVGYYKRHEPGTLELPVEAIPVKKDDDSDLIYKMEDFLNSIYYIESHCGDMSGEIASAFKFVKEMPQDIYGIKSIKLQLLRNLRYIAKLKTTWFIGDNKKNAEKAKPKEFINYEEFSTKFLYQAMPVLQRGEIPDFNVWLNPKMHLVSWIRRIAYTATMYFKEDPLSPNAIGTLLNEVYDFAVFFERSHYAKFDSRLIAGMKNFNTLKKCTQTVNERKQQYYPWLQAVATAMVAEKPKYSISTAAEKLRGIWHKMFKNVLAERFGTETSKPLNVVKSSESNIKFDSKFRSIWESEYSNYEYEKCWLALRNDKDDSYANKRLSISIKTIKDVACKKELATLNKKQKICRSN
jgi:hypothetical protein